MTSTRPRADEPSVDGTIDLARALDLLAEAVAERDRLRVLVEQLETALTSNRIIGDAIGILMARLRLDHDDAMATLIRTSKNSNRKLVDVASELVATHTAAVRRGAIPG